MEFLANSAFDFNSISNGTDAMHGDAELIDRINAINEINAITHPIPDNSILPKIASNKFGPPLHNLGSIIRGYKSAVTMAARAINPNFAWQRGYHDRVIQSEIQLKRIHAYIENNVRRWKHIDG
ncbi:hypothetical protein GC167_05235 [bacterium]|nr:hypothetical protein [bacterium]